MTTVALALLSLAALCLSELLGIAVLVAWCIRVDGKAQQPQPMTLPEQRRRSQAMAAHPATPVTRIGGGWR